MTGKSLVPDLDGVGQFLDFPQGRDGDAWESFLDGWASLLDIRESLPLIVNVSLAIVMYAAASAAIAVLVLQHSVMALVVFGMGGLLRFRTPNPSLPRRGRV